LENYKIALSLATILTTITLLVVIPHLANAIESLQNDSGKDTQLKYSFVNKWGSNGSGPGSL